MARRQPAALAGLAAVAAAACLATLARASLGFLQLPHQGTAPHWRARSASLAGASSSLPEHTLGQKAAAAAVAVAASAALAVAAGVRSARRPQAALRPQGRRGAVVAGLRPVASSSPSRVALAAWPWEDDDPYSKCTAMKLQVGMQFSKSVLETLNNLAETADTSSDEGLHQLLLDVVLALRRGESSWRYGNVERLIMDSEDGGREANAALQRWGIEGQSKWGDGEQWDKMDKNPSGTTEFLIITLLVSCYGTLCPGDEKLKVRSVSDMKKILDSVSGVQVDELMQLDVQWIPEEEGDTLSAMEVTMKFPELAML